MKNPCTVRSSVALLASLFLALTTEAFAQSPSGDVVISTNTAWAVGSYQFNSLTVNSGATLTVAGGSTLTVTAGITVTANSNIVLQGANTSAQVNGAWAGAGVTISAASVEVDAGSTINADGQGYVAGAGPGTNGGGGSYGGAGGSSQTPGSTYGSYLAPTDLGSGGSLGCCNSGYGNSGGGAIQFTVSGTLTLNGAITANGLAGTEYGGVSDTVATSGGGLGGSGGSINITAATITGSGSMTATGGVGGPSGGGGGGGGRIAVLYTTNSGFNLASITANGGTAAYPGSRGTVYLVDGSNNLTISDNLTFPASQTLTFNNITIGAGAGLTLGASTTLTSQTLGISGASTMTVGGGSAVTVTGALTVTGGSTIVAQAANTSAQVNGAWAGTGVTISAGSVQVDATSKISADGQGYVAGAGPGTTTNWAGGSYGGAGGGNTPGNTYGSVTTPVDLGSGGALGCCNSGYGNSGGGAIQLNVTGTLKLDGSITANGAAGTEYGGVSDTVATSGGGLGGSGGSIYITAATVTGSGSMTATGGVGGPSGGGGGGGGRIAVLYTANSGFNLASITANGGTAANPGSRGAVYLLDASRDLTVTDNLTLPANQTLNYDNIVLNNGAALTLGSGTTLTANSISVSNGGNFTVGGGSTINLSGALTVTGNSNIVLQGANTSAQVNGAWAGIGVTINAVSVEVDAGSTINADGQGYVVGAGPGTNSGGGSYGGVGGGNTPGSTYGSATAPVDLGSGGVWASPNWNSGQGAAGGGAVRLDVTGSLTLNGVISANGVAGTGVGGSGSGGSVYVITGSLAGSGLINANGGTGSIGGGGGRVAVYYGASTGFAQGQISVAGGKATNAGDSGTIVFDNALKSYWISPVGSVLYSAETLAWFTDAGTTVNVIASGPQIVTLGSALNASSSLSWDTTAVPDGRYELRLIFYDANGNDIQELPRTIVVNNSVVWHSGIIASNQEWTAANVQGLSGMVIIPSGVTLTIDPGTIVKALPGAEIIVQSGGVLNAVGTSSALPVIFTAFDDSSVGGNTDFTGSSIVPTPGEWNGISVQTGGQFNSNSNTDLWYAESNQTGTLPASEAWLGSQLYEVTGTVNVPSGMTLTIQPGTIVKFGANGGINVQAGGQLIAKGTLAQPIYFTSINDNSVGGTAAGSTGTPAPGDWGSVIINGTGATATFNHVHMLYGGGPQSATNQLGMIQTGSNAVVTISNSILGQSFWTGIWTGYSGGGDTVTITDSVVYGIQDRGINAWPGSTVYVVNDTFDGNGDGMMAHGGTVNIANTIVSNSQSTSWGGVVECCGGTFNISYSDVWNSMAGVPNYVGMTDPTGTDGNISANPVYVNATQRDYRLNYGSPAIDAGNGTVANYPLTDFMGDPRYNDPEVTTKTGVPDVNGNYPDMGAYEFVQSAPSDIDLTVSSVTGPATAVSGSQVQLTWTDTNTGSGTAQGPWHDAVYLVRDPDTNPVAILAGEVLVASGVTLGPGASYTATGTIRVPGSIVGNHRWEVKTNNLGEVFVGANAANSTGISLDMVAIELPELVADSPALNNTFAATGQSWWYKLTPGANKGVNVNLNLAGSTGAIPGAVQLFIGQGYVPTPQQYDIQQVEWNSPSASVVIPSTTSQTYYVTAYAQSLTSAPAPFTLAATTLKYSFSALQPNSVVNSGSATLTFVGGGFTSGASYQLVGSGGTVYNAISVFVADSTHADVTFAMSGVPTGIYTAQVIENGSTVSLTNALTVTAASNPVSNPGASIQVTLDTPEDFRAGFPALVTLNYQNISGSDLPAPLMILSADTATLAEIPQACNGCSNNFAQQYQASFSSTFIMGINHDGPAGILPAGGGGSIKFLATPTGSGSVNFSVDIVAGDFLGFQNDSQAPLGYDNTGFFVDAATLCAAFMPDDTSAYGMTRPCMQFLKNAGYALEQCGTSSLNQMCGVLTSDNFNAMLAADATALSQRGIYESNASRLMNYELEKDGAEVFNRRYHQGAFGFGPSHDFDVTAGVNPDGNYAIYYPNGNSRIFFTADPNNATHFLGIPGDYGVLATNMDGSWTLTEANGATEHFIVDTAANTTQHHLLDYMQDLNGNRLSLSYTNDLVTSVSDTNGDTITFAYDSFGHITKYTDQVGRTISYTYDILNDANHSTFLTSITDAAGTRTFQWNEGGPNGVGYFNDACVVTYCEPAIGINTITYPDGTHIYYTYDGLGRLASAYMDGNAQTVTYTYDDVTGAVTIVDALGNQRQQFPDVFGTLAQAVDALSAVTRYAYNPEHKLTQIFTPLEGAYGYSYDTQGNIAQLTDPVNDLTSLSYGATENLLSISDAAGNATSANYDSNGNPTSVTYPDTSTRTATYDAHGNVTKATNRRGRSIGYAFDGKNQLLTKSYANGSQATFTYDAHRNLLTATNASGTTSFSYDAADRTTSVTYPNGKLIKYTYNAGGQRASMTDSSGTTLQYAYDAAGKLQTITDAANNTIVSNTYDAAGNLTRKTLGNGAYTTYAYDANGRVQHLVNYTGTGVAASQFDYTYDAEGKPTAIATSASVLSFAYDADGQLTSATEPGASVAYAYDAAGNRTSSSLNGISSTYLVNNLNEYTAAAANTYLYDADGNMTAGGGWTCTYDDENQLTGMTSATDTWSFQYDALGNRIASIHNGTVTDYLIDPVGLGNVVAEFDGKGNLISHTTFGPSLISTTPAGSASVYYQFDGAGNTVQLTNNGGTLTNTFSYLPFGEKLTSTGATPYTYGGQWGVLDEGNGLYFMRYRWYSPSLGRFTQPDPAGLMGGDANLYRYAVNRPLDLIDPIGLLPPEVTTALQNKVISKVNENVPGVSQAVDTVTALKSIKDAAGPTGNANNSNGMVQDPGTGSFDPENKAELKVDKQAGEVTYDLATGGSSAAGYLKKNPSLSWEGIKQDIADSIVNEYYTLDSLQNNPYLNPNQYKRYWPFGTQKKQKTPQVPTTPTGNHKPVPVPGSHDPNEKITSGFGDQGFVPPGVPITYTIYFENEASATAPAEIVNVTDPLDANLDWSTVQLNQIQFNGTTINVPGGQQSYTGQATVSTSTYPVNVNASLNASTGVFTWNMQSVDPATGSLPADPLAGFLPPNNASNQGTGYVTFSVMPKTGLANGTTISNQASIVFDVNAAIATNTVTNTIDSVYPTSSVSTLSATTASTSFTVSWSGSDPAGAGIASYNIFVAVNSGSYSLWLPATTATSATYTGAVGNTYSFYSMATDNVGHQQLAAGQVQTTAVMSLATVTVTPNPSSITTAQALTVTVTVSGGSGNPTPTGSVTLSGGGYASTAQTLSGGSYDFIIPANSLTSGIDTLTVSYSGDSNYASANGTAPVTVTALPLTPTVTVTPAATTLDSGSALSVAVAVTGAGIIPTGTVTLSGGGYTSAAEPLSGGNYTFTIPVNSLSAGTDTLTVSYSGDSNYVAGTGTASVTVTASVFSLAASTPTAVSPGSPATSTVTVSTATGYAGTVTLTCALTSSPNGATDLPTCSGGSSTVTLGGSTTSGTATVTVSSTAATSAMAQPDANGFGRAWAGGSSVLAFLVFLGIPARRRSWRAMLGVLLLMAALGGLAACGGHSNSTGSGNQGTTAGTYTFTVTGTGSPSVAPAPATTFTLTIN
jgi:RHS repeat-associated protein